MGGIRPRRRGEPDAPADAGSDDADLAGARLGKSDGAVKRGEGGKGKARKMKVAKPRPGAAQRGKPEGAPMWSRAAAGLKSGGYFLRTQI